VAPCQGQLSVQTWLRPGELELADEPVEEGAQLTAEGANTDDEYHGDQGDHQAVFDGGGAFFIVAEAGLESETECVQACCQTSEH
jgi:hypothetical protein